MGIQLFGSRSRLKTRMILPSGYRANVRWRPQLGDIFPDFTADSTQGLISFHAWAETGWTFLFSHPAAYTPVCSTEIADVAFSHDALKKRGVKPISISGDTLSDLSAWSKEVAETFGTEVNFPLVADPDHVVTQAAGMEHPKEIDGYAIRKSFLVDPSLRIRMIFEYPVFVGRNMDEVLRVIDALKVVDRGGVATPSGWHPGDPVLQAAPNTPYAGTGPGIAKQWTELRSYLKVSEG